MNWMVRALFPTPPPPTTTSLSRSSSPLILVLRWDLSVCNFQQPNAETVLHQRARPRKTETTSESGSMTQRRTATRIEAWVKLLQKAHFNVPPKTICQHPPEKLTLKALLFPSLNWSVSHLVSFFVQLLNFLPIRQTWKGGTASSFVRRT